MPRDSRLYMTFPIDFWKHEKVSRLSDAAFRAFVESNGYSRERESDGVIEPDDAVFLWKPEALAELVKSHPSRPLMFCDADGNYVLRDYAEHQFTKADRDELSEKRAKAGRASADARKARAEQVLNAGQHPATESESESGLDDSSKTSTSQSLDNRARETTDALSPALKALASQAGLRDVPAIREEIRARTGCEITLDRTVGVARWLIEKSPKPVTRAQGYVMTCLRDTPAEIQQHIYSEGGL